MGPQRSDRRDSGPLGRSAASTLAAAAVLLLAPTAARADNPYSTTPTQQQQILDYGPGTGKPKSIFDAKNPGDLINTLRRGAALDNATPPGDAVDRALRALEAQNAPAVKPPLKGP